MPGRLRVDLLVGAVEPELVEADDHAPDRVDVLRAVDRVELRRGDVPGALDGPRLHVLRHRVLVLVGLEDDLVDLGRALPVILIRDHADELALLPLHALEGT